MGRIRSKDTIPELKVRSLIHRLGYRFRLHRSDLPGSPDMVFTGRKKVIFVHGCFWHRHAGCRKGKLPKSNLIYWKSKLVANKKRDVANRTRLESQGWFVLVVWQCELKRQEELKDRLIQFLEHNTPSRPGKGQQK